MYLGTAEWLGTDPTALGLVILSVAGAMGLIALVFHFRRKIAALHARLLAEDAEDD